MYNICFDLKVFLFKRKNLVLCYRISPDMAKCSMNKEAVDRGVRGSGTGSVRDKIDSKIPLIESGLVTGLEVMNQTVWAVHGQQSSVHAYPLTSPHQPQTFPLKGLSCAVDMVRFPPGQSQISDGDNKQLLWIKLDQRNGVWMLTSQRSVKVIYRPAGLGVRNNQLLVCDDNVIHVLSTSGEETHRVNMPQGVKPWKAVAQLTSPGFVIMDIVNDKVVLVTETGEVQHKYRGQKGFGPADIVCHGHSIYVTDYDNDRVDELSVDGRHVRQLIRGEGVRMPYSVCVDDTDHLYVAHGEYRENKKVFGIETIV